MIEITSKIVINPDMSLTFTAQTHGRPEVVDEARKLVKEFGSFCNLKVTRPYHPRSSGERSQNSHIWGHCTDLSMQAKSKEWTPAAVHQLMKALAVKEGKDYPHITYRGIMIYASDAEINSLQANNLIEMIHQFADQNDFWLTEYSDETPPRAYKSKGGRTLKEMLENYPELNQELRKQPEPEMVEQGQTQEQQPQESATEPEKIDPDANIEQGDIDSFFDGIF